MPVLSLPAYDVTIGPLGEAHQTWLAERSYAGIAVLVDENTRQHCWPRLATWLPDAQPLLIDIASGELNKHLGTCQHIWDRLFEAGVGRRWCLINLGGGVIGDMGGFCAATYKRGIDFIQIPTTLLSQVDASVGGKLGVDYGGYKNSIGVFKEPAAVWVDPNFLATLPAREIRSGFAEIIKHALIADAGQWRKLQDISELSTVDWVPFIQASVAIKRDIVLSDFYETGPRKALNFGHTIGHAIESFRLDGPAPLLHGEAIAIGMITEAWLSVRDNGLSEAELQEISAMILRHYGHEPVPEEALPALLALMQQDKKNEASEINITKLPAIGQVLTNGQAEAAAIGLSIQYYNQLASSTP